MSSSWLVAFRWQRIANPPPIPCLTHTLRRTYGRGNRQWRFSFDLRLVLHVLEIGECSLRLAGPGPARPANTIAVALSQHAHKQRNPRQRKQRRTNHDQECDSKRG